jgi:hypothetical protein
VKRDVTELHCYAVSYDEYRIIIKIPAGLIPTGPGMRNHKRAAEIAELLRQLAETEASKAYGPSREG